MAHAVGLVHQGDMVQLWHGRVAHEGKDLIEVLNKLGKMVLKDCNSDRPLDNFYFPEHRSWQWANWTDRKLTPLPPERVAEPFMKLTWKGELVGVILKVTSLNQIKVFSFNNTFFCEKTNPWGYDHGYMGWHVKNFIDCIEGPIIERMLREHHTVQ